MLTATLTHIQEFTDLVHSRGYQLTFEVYTVEDPATVYRDYLPAALTQLMEEQGDCEDFKLQLRTYPEFVDEFDYREMYWSLQYSIVEGFTIRQMELFSRNPLGQHIFPVESNSQMPARQTVVSHFARPPSVALPPNRRHGPLR